MATDKAAILSPVDVRNIRNYVQHKYAAIPNEERSEIVADAMNRIIYKQLPAFDDLIKKHVAEQIIRSAVMEQQRPVRADDIFAACIYLDLTKPNLFEPLHAWIEQQVRAAVNKDKLQLVLDKLHKQKDSDLGLSDAEGIDFWQKLKIQLEESVILTEVPRLNDQTSIIVSLPIPIKKKLLERKLLYSVLSIILVLASLLYGWSLSWPSSSRMQPPTAVNPVKTMKKEATDGLPLDLRYHSINKPQLKAYLQKKSSLLADDHYMNAIIAQAKAFDIHPLLLFAITGQEQGFVPRDNKDAKQIANNPFNVFYSWKDYNTTIHDSAEIAARTITNLSKGRPDHIDPVKWINRKYAEDPNWSNGVNAIFNTLQVQVEGHAER